METIASSEIVRHLRMENPWWGEAHSVVAAHREMKARAHLRHFLDLLRMEVRRALVLMGPRRVGKTVMIHHAIQSLLEEGVDPRCICYLSVDNPIYNGLSIERLLGHFLAAMWTGVDHRDATLYIFLDEIQYLRQWEVHLKSAVDSHPNIRWIASGSAAAALRLKSEESGAGRFTDFRLPPLTFHEYLYLLDLDSLVSPPEARSGAFFDSPDLPRLNQAFVDYLNYGGYPEVIFSRQIQANPGRFIKNDIIDKVLLRDLPSLYGIGDIQELNSLFTVLSFNTGNEISLGELAQNSGVAKNTLKRYIQYLEAAFLIQTVHRVDHGAKKFRRANFFKVYLTNPSMRAALFSPAQDGDDALGRLAETAVFGQWFRRDSPLYYARWQDGEVDMVSLGPNQKPEWAVEVKWSDRYGGNASELRGLLGFCHANALRKVLVTSRTRNETHEVEGITVRSVPVSLYCYTVGYDLVEGHGSMAA